tara:strand:+ start:558 stop:707 length:150 start_codon:yes stop_codon:yes gene_type:complete
MSGSYWLQIVDPARLFNIKHASLAAATEGSETADNPYREATTTIRGGRV